jgi:hypothetical protein
MLAPKVAVARDREDVDLVAEKVGEDQAEPDRMSRDADQDEDRRRPV